jgi:chemotaxis family two-component system sensor kinase Cph1
MRQFLDQAVHDLRAALRKIATSGEILLEEHPEIAACPAILAGVARSTAILAGISSYSTALGVARYSFAPVRAELALDAALRSLDGQIRETGAIVTHSALPEVVADKERLTDMFRILISNALTYRNTDPPQVDVSAQASSDRWIVSVRDNGIGIAPKYQERVFDPFYRLHGSEIPGVGLGLATCRKILEAHRGQIWIESEEGAGATFLFTLPLDHQ